MKRIKHSRHLKDKKVKIGRRPFLMGFVGSLILLMVYFGILTIANSFNHAVEQFVTMWYWILLLVVGFGTQVGLYSYVRISMRAKHMAGATAELATAGGVSTGSMIACCAHHITDVIPILGLSAAAVFLTKYQLAFIALGVLSNLVGITMMLNIIQKHNLFSDHGLFKNIFKYDMKLARNITIVMSVIIFSFVFVTTTGSIPTGLIFARSSTGYEDEIYEDNINQNTVDLPSRINEESGVSFEVTPTDFTFDTSVKFDVAIDTHQGSLDFDLTEISILEDDKGNEYLPLKWEGSSPGGHHRYGVLTFPKIDDGAKSIRLIIRNVYGVTERIFVWKLK